MNRELRKNLLDAAWYVVVFLLIQMVIALIVQGIYKGDMLSSAVPLIVISVASSILTIALFLWRRWFVAGQHFLRSCPWAVLAWVVILAIGTIIPSEWLTEVLGLEMPVEQGARFSLLMSKPLGYVAIGIMVPLAEEIVFRGALLRTLFKVFTGRHSHWIAIFVSAVVFGACHGNWPQFLHGTLFGILLGWMYYRTGSIVPGLVLHWVNNSIAYIVCNLMPNLQNGNLIDLFNGDSRRVLLYVGFSCCLVFPALFQLHLRMKKEEG